MEIQYFQVKDPLEGITKINYDESGNISGVTDANGGVTRYAYDSVGRLLEEINPIDARYEYTYNAQGLPEELCAYNGAGQLISQRDIKTAAEGEEPEEITHYTYSYDGYGNVTSIEGTQTLEGADGLSRLNGAKMTYDEANRLLMYNGEEIRYDADGNMTYGPVNGVMSDLTGGIKVHYMFDIDGNYRGCWSP